LPSIQRELVMVLRYTAKGNPYHDDLTDEEMAEFEAYL
jgi:hypothetical protein